MCTWQMLVNQVSFTHMNIGDTMLQLYLQRTDHIMYIILTEVDKKKHVSQKLLPTKHSRDTWINI